jgi:Na+-driven multidrug efflux pump
MAAVMRGVGKPVLPMVVFLTCWCVVRVAILKIAAEVIGKSIQTTYWVYPITWILSTVVLYISYRRIKFRN